MSVFIKKKLETLNAAREQCIQLQADLKEIIFIIYNSGDYTAIQKILPRLDLIADDVEKIKKELPIKLKIFDDMVKKLEKDISKIEDEKTIIANLLFDYLEKVHTHIDLIDSNSAIKIRDKSKKALRIDIPKWEEHYNIYLQKIMLFIDSLCDICLAAFHQGKDIHDIVSSRVTTKEMYDKVIGIDEIAIHLMKVESQREVMIPWRAVTTNSGGEGFLSSFIVLSSLLSYMRHEENDPFSMGKNEGKILLMDNPFGKTNASHLLKPLMEVAKKNNLQLICLTGLGGDSIYDRFDNIYVLNLVPASNGALNFVKTTCEKGANLSVLSLAHLQIMDQDSLLKLFVDDIELDTHSDEPL
ncbi:MAG: hypothetical protein J5803_03455 [Desulfovibrio sp.]|nr:hypothetical protein [Desulfovibrio sp.]